MTIKSKKIIVIYITVLLIIISNISLMTNINAEAFEAPAVKINIEPYTTIYEGDIIDCNITGIESVKYWTINNLTKHYTFHNDNPVIFDPEPTPLEDNYVDFTVYVQNQFGNSSDTVKLKIKRIYFGDIHWHSLLCDGKNPLDVMYSNAIIDNYLDFAAYSGHAERLDTGFFNHYWARDKNQDIELLALEGVLDQTFNVKEWDIVKNTAIEYYDPGNFTTLLGFECSQSEYHPGGWPWSPFGHEDRSHINFYYKDVYADAKDYGSLEKFTFDDIFEAMAKEWDKGNFNVGYPHHPLGQINFFNSKISFACNWSFLAENIKNTEDRDKVIRGAEVYSNWGQAIGKFSGLPITNPYGNPINQKDTWVENAMWEWSENLKGRKFVMMASSDTHKETRPGGSNMQIQNHPSGVIAAYSVHNKRSEIWDAMNNCSTYGTQILKIRTNVRFDGKMAYGSWINCTSPLEIQITAHSTFPGLDSSGKNMCPYGYSSDELDYPIKDIWLVKKDRDRGRPWCKIIGHSTPNSNMAVINFTDSDVQPNDFYYVAILQQGQAFEPAKNNISPNLSDDMAFLGTSFSSISSGGPFNIIGYGSVLVKKFNQVFSDLTSLFKEENDKSGNEYMAFIGPVFIDNVS